MNVLKVHASQHTFVFAAKKDQKLTEHHLLSAQERYNIIFILVIVHIHYCMLFSASNKATILYKD